MNEDFRAFIGIDLNENLREFILNLQDELRKLNCDIKWVKPVNAHLTLKFLGDISPAQADEISKQLIAIFKSEVQFNTALKDFGSFPENKRPRTIWLGLKDPDNIIKVWFEKIESAFEELGFVSENREFKAHITIGRVRSGKNIDALIEQISSFSINSDLPLSIGSIRIYKSTLTTNGPIYEVIHQIPLKNPC